MANSPVSQCGKILRHMQSGQSITPAQAHDLYGTLALHSRINELRSRGHDIACELVDTPSGKVVGKYTLRAAQEGPGAHGKVDGQVSLPARMASSVDARHGVASASRNPAPSAPLSSAIDHWEAGQTRISFGRKVLVIAAGFSAHDGTAFAETRDLGPA